MDEFTIAHPSGTRARVCPERGGMATALEVDGRHVFFLDEGTLRDPAKNVRGGAPVLFPTPGRLRGDAWSWRGRSGTLPQHGFARNRPWTVVSADGGAVALALEPDASIRAIWPWEFRVELGYAVGPRSLTIDARVENRSQDVMPFGFGFHPYFALADKKAFRLDSGASRAFDNTAGRDVPFAAGSLDLGAGEVDLHLHDHPGSSIGFAADARVTIDAAGFPHMVLWSLPDRRFVCVEPWTCPGDAMNSGDRLTLLAPGASQALRCVIRVA